MASECKTFGYGINSLLNHCIFDNAATGISSHNFNFKRIYLTENTKHKNYMGIKFNVRRPILRHRIAAGIGVTQYVP